MLEDYIEEMTTKKEILIYDYVDDNFAKTWNMFLKKEKDIWKIRIRNIGWKQSINIKLKIVGNNHYFNFLLNYIYLVECQFYQLEF